MEGDPSLRSLLVSRRDLFTLRPPLSVSACWVGPRASARLPCWPVRGSPGEEGTSRYYLEDTLAPAGQACGAQTSATAAEAVCQCQEKGLAQSCSLWASPVS